MLRPMPVILVASLLAAGCADGQAPASQAPSSPAAALPGEPVSAETLVSLVRGNTMQGTTANNEPFAVHVAPDLSQRLRVTLSNGRVVNEAGRLSTQGDLACSSWTTIRNGAPLCTSTRREGDTFRSYAAGRLNSTFTIRPGNPEGL